MTDDEPLSAAVHRIRHVREERNRLANTIVGGLVVGLDPVLYAQELQQWAALTTEFDRLTAYLGEGLGL